MAKLSLIINSRPSPSTGEIPARRRRLSGATPTIPRHWGNTGLRKLQKRDPSRPSPGTGEILSGPCFFHQPDPTIPRRWGNTATPGGARGVGPTIPRRWGNTRLLPGGCRFGPDHPQTLGKYRLLSALALACARPSPDAGEIQRGWRKAEPIAPTIPRRWGNTLSLPH